MNKIDLEQDESGVLPRGTIKRIVQQERLALPWLTENQIYSLRKRRQENKLHNIELARQAKEFDCEQGNKGNMEDDMTDDDSSFDSMQSNGHLYYDIETLRTAGAALNVPFQTAVGRKKGSTNKERQEEVSKSKALRDSIAETWHEIQYEINDKAKDNTMLFELIAIQKGKFDSNEHISESTIRSRCRRGNLTDVQRGRISPMEDVEPTLCCLLVYASRMGQYVSQGKCITMANELIRGTLVGRRLSYWKLKYVHACRERYLFNRGEIPSETVGWGWFRGFQKRHSEITSKYVSNMKHYRSTWSTYAMLLDMYQIVYGLFVEWGHAVKLPQPQWQDEHGNEVPKERAMGSQVEYKLLYPDRILTMDETGDNGNQAKDFATREHKVICETDGPQPKKACAIDDTSWTVQGFTTLGGKAVLFVIILKKAAPLNFNEHYGFDLEAPWIGEGENACDNGQLPTQEQMNRNKGPERRWPGPISCEFNGITIPSLVVASKGGGVNDDILAAALRHLDELNVFPREEGVPHPTLLVDGHGSRLQPKFVQYINNLKADFTADTDADHRWNCALGLPHSTHHWQVGDSAEENQAFKYHSRVKKDRIRDLQEKINRPPSIKRFHVVPICNFAFRRSFMKEESVKRAVAARGWNPLNMNCLHKKEILQTKVSEGMTYSKRNLTPAELACVKQGEGIIDLLNLNGDVCQQVFRNCAKKQDRLFAQEQRMKEKREARKKQNGIAMLEVFGKVTSGKLYDNGVASVNDPNLITLLRTKRAKEDETHFIKECKKYIEEKKKFDEGESLFSSVCARKEQHGSIIISNRDLDRLIRWKWSALPHIQRPKVKELSGKTKEETRRIKVSTWEAWELRTDPLPPLMPTDFETYSETAVKEVMQGAPDLQPAQFPNVSNDVVVVSQAEGNQKDVDASDTNEEDNDDMEKDNETEADDESSKGMQDDCEMEAEMSVLSGFDSMASEPFDSPQSGIRTAQSISIRPERLKR